MPDTPTPKLGLTRDLTSENYDVGKVNANNMKIDAAMGVTICTAATRPATPYLGQRIYETDTGWELICTSVGPAVWTPSTSVKCTAATRPNPAREGMIAAETDTGRKIIYLGGAWVDLGIQKTITGFGGSSAVVKYETTGAIASNRVVDVRKNGEAERTWNLDFDGKMQWGPGGAVAPDNTLERAALGMRLNGKYIPLGILGIQQPTGNVPFTGTETLVDSITFVHTSGRYERGIFNSRFSLNTAGVAIMRYRYIAGSGPVNNTHTQIYETIPTGSGSNNHMSISKVFPSTFRSLASGTYTVGVFAAAAAGASSGTINGVAGNLERDFVIEDVGAP